MLDIIKKLYYTLIAIYYSKVRGISLGKNVTFSKNFHIRPYTSRVSIGNNCKLEDTLINSGNAEVIIGNNCFFGHRVQILARSHAITTHAHAEQITYHPITI